MSNHILSQSTHNGDSTTQEALPFTRNEQGVVTLDTTQHEFLTRQIIPFLSRELRQALERLASYDPEAAYQAALEVSIDVMELGSALKALEGGQS